MSIEEFLFWFALIVLAGPVICAIGGMIIFSLIDFVVRLWGKDATAIFLD